MSVYWRIYYVDGSSFDNTQGSVFDALWHGVVCIRCKDNKYNSVILNQWDFYYFDIDNNTWQGSQSDFILLMLAKYPKRYVALKFGETIPNEQYDHILTIAKCDPDFQQASPALNTLSNPKTSLFKGKIEHG